MSLFGLKDRPISVCIVEIVLFGTASWSFRDLFYYLIPALLSKGSENILKNIQGDFMSTVYIYELQTIDGRTEYCRRVLNFRSQYDGPINKSKTKFRKTGLSNVYNSNDFRTTRSKPYILSICIKKKNDFTNYYRNAGCCKILEYLLIIHKRFNEIYLAFWSRRSASRNF